MSKTPRTDFAWNDSNVTADELANHSRQLETELNQWREVSEELANLVEHGMAGGSRWRDWNERSDKALNKINVLKKGTK